MSDFAYRMAGCRLTEHILTTGKRKRSSKSLRPGHVFSVENKPDSCSEILPSSQWSCNIKPKASFCCEERFSKGTDANGNLKFNSIWDINEEDVKHNYNDGTVVDGTSLQNIIINYGGIEMPNKPTESFEKMNIHSNILEGLYCKEYFLPNGLQKILLPYLVRNKKNKYNATDIVVHAGQKTGKTTSALIALSTYLADSTSKSSKALITCPTFESTSTIFEMGKAIAELCPKLTFRQEIKKHNKITERIIVGTPEKIKNLLINNLIDAKEIEVTVFDEVHLMIPNQGHVNPLLKIAEIIPKNSQLIMLSSSSSDKPMKKFIEKIKKERSCPFLFESCIEQPSIFKERQFFISCKNTQVKKETLTTVISKRAVSQIVIICQSKTSVEDVYNFLIGMNVSSVSSLSGKLAPSKRQIVLQDFKANKITVLITTPSYANLLTPNLKTIVCYDQFLTTDYQIDFQSYQKWMSVLSNHKESVLINFVEERYASHLFKANDLPVVEREKLAMKLNEIM